MSDEGGDMRDRLSKRLEPGEGEEEAGKSIKEEWTARTLYLPEDLGSYLDNGFLEAALLHRETDLDGEMGKLRQYYLLIVVLGLERVEEMEPNELERHLDELEKW